MGIGWCSGLLSLMKSLWEDVHGLDLKIQNGMECLQRFASPMIKMLQLERSWLDRIKIPERHGWGPFVPLHTSTFTKDQKTTNSIWYGARVALPAPHFTKNSIIGWTWSGLQVFKPRGYDFGDPTRPTCCLVLNGLKEEIIAGSKRIVT